MTNEKIVYHPSFYARQSGGSCDSAKRIVPILMDLINPETVIDIGCGIGTWLAEFKLSGAAVHGVDGEYCKKAGLLIPESDFIATDLLQCSLDGKIEGVDKKFSLCLSLEVAEHLPPEYSKEFVSLLTNFSEVVLFSAAIPYQGGTNHINEQWMPYWIEKFRKLGYIPSDVIRTLVWGDSYIEPWYRQNMVLFLKEGETYARYKEKIKELMAMSGDDILSKVHPNFYLQCIDYYYSEDFLCTLKASVLLSSFVNRLYNQSRKTLKRIVKIF